VLRANAVAGRIGIGRTGHHVVASSTDALGFERADDGFRVVVSRQLPKLLEVHLPALVDAFIGPASDLDAIALHPGGLAIVDAVTRCLSLREAQVAATRSVLTQFGNTSSAAILFVLEQLAASVPGSAGRGLAAAFGPGLMVELLELTWSS
jgi:predicted naringenin-chalcone synthase